MSRRTMPLLGCALLVLVFWPGRSPSWGAQDTTDATATPSPTPVPRYLIGFRAAWDNAMDLGLLVYQESTDEWLYWGQYRSSSGGQLDPHQGNGSCSEPVAEPYETATWYAGTPPDRYFLQIQITDDCGVSSDPHFELSTIWSDGEELEHSGTLTADAPEWQAWYTHDGTPPLLPLEPYGPLVPSEEPMYGTTVLGAEDIYQEMVMGGPINLGDGSGTAFVGFVQSNPHLCFETAGGSGTLWLQTSMGYGDPALIVVDPRNRWWYNDDAGSATWIIAPDGFDIVDAPVSSDDTDPLLRLSDPPAGKYCVWLASLTGGHHETRLRISLQPE